MCPVISSARLGYRRDVRCSAHSEKVARAQDRSTTLFASPRALAFSVAIDSDEIRVARGRGAPALYAILLGGAFWKQPCRSTCGLVAMTSASHAEGRQFDPGQVYLRTLIPASLPPPAGRRHCGHVIACAPRSQACEPCREGVCAVQLHQCQAAIAQLAARRSHNPKVVSSILTGRILDAPPSGVRSLF